MAFWTREKEGEDGAVDIEAAAIEVLEERLRQLRAAYSSADEEYASLRYAGPARSNARALQAAVEDDTPLVPWAERLNDAGRRRAVLERQVRDAERGLRRARAARQKRLRERYEDGMRGVWPELGAALERVYSALERAESESARLKRELGLVSSMDTSYPHAQVREALDSATRRAGFVVPDGARQEFLAALDSAPGRVREREAQLARNAERERHLRSPEVERARLRDNRRLAEARAR